MCIFVEKGKANHYKDDAWMHSYCLNKDALFPVDNVSKLISWRELQTNDYVSQHLRSKHVFKSTLLPSA